ESGFTDVMQDDLILQPEASGENDRAVQLAADTAKPLDQIQASEHTIEIGCASGKGLKFFCGCRNGSGVAVKGEHQSAARNVTAQIERDTPSARINIIQIGRNRIR